MKRAAAPTRALTHPSTSAADCGLSLPRGAIAAPLRFASNSPYADEPGVPSRSASWTRRIRKSLRIDDSIDEVCRHQVLAAQHPAPGGASRQLSDDAPKRSRGGRRLLQIGIGKTDHRAGRNLRKPVDIRADHGGDFRITARCRAIAKQYERLPVPGHLDGARQHSVGNYVEARPVDERPTLQPATHSIGLRGHPVRD